jgi:GTPase SAR1 family protein
VDLEICGTAGAECYRPITKLYYQKEVAAAAVFDVTDGKTVQNLPFWIDSFRANSASTFVVVVGNKSDHEKHQVALNEMEDLAQKQSADLIVTSALNGRDFLNFFRTSLNISMMRNTAQCQWRRL